MDGVISAGKNYKADSTTSVNTNDEYLCNQWYLDRINTSDAWDAVDKLSTSYEIWVAVIDSGVDINHEDLKDRILTDSSVDITGKKPVMLTDMEVPYVSGHGTAVSGILAANANNGIGIAGVTGMTPSK